VIAHMSKMPIRQAVILVGGRGTRLGEIARDLPKPMLPIAGGSSMLDYLLEMIERHDYQDILRWPRLFGQSSDLDKLYPVSIMPPI
jgi:molybdopterin-guanine dinucleotide biosynthesis protein A